MGGQQQRSQPGARTVSVLGTVCGHGVNASADFVAICSRLSRRLRGANPAPPASGTPLYPACRLGGTKGPAPLSSLLLWCLFADGDSFFPFDDGAMLLT